MAASQAIMRRIWPGVAATARSRAISRSRCWIERPMVLATTNMAMNMASPPNAAVTGIRRGPHLLELRILGLAAARRRSAPPHRLPRCAGHDTSKPGPASTPMASTRPGWPARRVASASVRKMAVCCDTGWRGRATPDDRDRPGRLGGRQAPAGRRAGRG